MLYSFNWPNFIVWLYLLLEISSNMCIVIVFYPVCDAINFEIHFSFLIKPFSYITKQPEQKFKKNIPSAQNFTIYLFERRKVGKISSHKQLWTDCPWLRNWYLNLKTRRAFVNGTAVFPRVKGKHYMRVYRKRMKKVSSINIVVDKNLFLYLHVNT